MVLFPILSLWVRCYHHIVSCDLIVPSVVYCYIVSAYLVILYCYRQTGGGCKLAFIDRASGLSSCSHKALLKTDQRIVRHLPFGGCSMRYIFFGYGVGLSRHLGYRAPLHCQFSAPVNFKIQNTERGIVQIPVLAYEHLLHREMSKYSFRGLHFAKQSPVLVKEHFRRWQISIYSTRTLHLANKIQFKVSLELA